MNNNTKPFLKWAGNKVGSLAYLQPLFPKAKRLIEPFVGSGALLINTDYPQYILADINNDLIILFQLIQRDGLPFIDYCADFFLKSIIQNLSIINIVNNLIRSQTYINDLLYFYI